MSPVLTSLYFTAMQWRWCWSYLSSQTTFIEVFLFISCHHHPIIIIVRIIVQFVILNCCALRWPGGQLFVFSLFSGEVFFALWLLISGLSADSSCWTGVKGSPSVGCQWQIFKCSFPLFVTSAFFSMDKISIKECFHWWIIRVCGGCHLTVNIFFAAVHADSRSCLWVWLTFCGDSSFVSVHFKTH